MRAFEIIKKGFIKEKKIPSFILDSEILLKNIKSIKADQKINNKTF